MNSDEILAKITTIMRETFNAPALVISPEMTAKDVKGWDSMKNIWLIVAIEDSFNIKLTTSEVIKVESISDYVALIQDKISN
ncbi:MAG: acyl carrier protein [Magnetococcales bacterium]|nr:acyl carrier protein [Magnetococcales bacterium]